MKGRGLEGAGHKADEILWQLLDLLIDAIPSDIGEDGHAEYNPDQRMARLLLDEWDKARKEETKP